MTPQIADDRHTPPPRNFLTNVWEMYYAIQRFLKAKLMISRCNKPNKKMLFINQMITTISCLVRTIIWSIFCAPPGAGGFRARGDGSRRWDAFLNHVGVGSGRGILMLISVADVSEWITRFPLRY